ncbi:hypothetical protein ACFQH6_07030 [Halobacteriaceae archaeon GCM10025711]
MGIISSLIGFVVSLLVGGFGIYVGGRMVTDSGDYEQALWTAVFGALGWAVVSLFFGWIPILGGLVVPVVALALWVGIVNWRYPGGWTEALLIGLVAWLASLLTLWVLSLVGVTGLDAFGVPGV